MIRNNKGFTYIELMMSFSLYIFLLFIVCGFIAIARNIWIVEMLDIQNQQYARYTMLKLDEVINQADYIKKHPYLNGFIVFNTYSTNNNKIYMSAEGYYYNGHDKKIMWIPYDDKIDDKDNFIEVDLLDRNNPKGEVFFYNKKYGKIDMNYVMSSLREELGRQPLVENVQNFDFKVIYDEKKRFVDVLFSINIKPNDKRIKNVELTTRIQK